MEASEHQPKEPTERQALLGFTPLAKVAIAASISMSLGLTALVIAQGFSDISAVKLVEQIAVVLLTVLVILGGFATLAIHLSDWRNPVTEEEFEKIVLQAEKLAKEGLAAEPLETEFMEELDPLDDHDFEKLVKDALDNLPKEFLNTLAHTPVVISDDGQAHHAYGLYQGATIAHPEIHDRIIIFRDTLRRDFGYNPNLLRSQVTRTVRHELAHHVGFDEPGVGSLGL